ncbi:MAG: peptide-methionine (S)-S-oxide reductase MsrA [Paracoccaceae bacterium]
MRHSLQDMKPMILSVLIALGLMLQCGRAEAGQRESIILAGGCFWCVEANFESVPGVVSAVSGFTGGNVKNPSYEDVKTGKTGHYEAVKVTFDSARISRDEILDLYFHSSDPTDAGGQFCDRGAPWRTAVFVSDKAQRQAAEAAKARAMTALGRKIVTPIRTAGAFYPAEELHQGYYRGSKRLITRWGIKTQAEAYKRYRKACGRDAKVKKLWGRSAAFAG